MFVITQICIAAGQYPVTSILNVGITFNTVTCEMLSCSDLISLTLRDKSVRDEMAYLFHDSLPYLF